MNSFPQGILVEKQGAPGLYYELEFRLATGEALAVFYQWSRQVENDPLGELFEPDTSSGKKYEFLLILRALRHVHYNPVSPADFASGLVAREIKTGQGDIVRRNDLVRGKIVDPSWNAASQTCLAIAPGMDEQLYVLLATDLGNVVISHKALQAELAVPAAQLAPGGYLEWKQGRIDLLAVTHVWNAEEEVR